MLVRKLIFSTQIFLFFDKEFKKFIINPYFYLYIHGRNYYCYYYYYLLPSVLLHSTTVLICTKKIDTSIFEFGFFLLFSCIVYLVYFINYFRVCIFVYLLRAVARGGGRGQCPHHEFLLPPTPIFET